MQNENGGKMITLPRESGIWANDEKAIFYYVRGIKGKGMKQDSYFSLSFIHNLTL